MIITENNIDKALNYFDSLEDKKFEILVDSLLDEQAYLSTFIQQNLDTLFKNNEEIKDLAYNLYFTILFVFKNKYNEKYIIVGDDKLNKILARQNQEHKQEELGDFIFTQLVESKFAKDDFMKILGLLNVVIICLNN